MGIMELPRSYQVGFEDKKRKPSVHVEIDWSNPITRGMKRCILTGLTHNNRDFVSGLMPSPAGSFQYVADDVGFASELDGYIEYGQTVGASSVAERTLFSVASSDRPSANSAYHALSLSDASQAFDYVTLSIQAGTEFGYQVRDNGSQWALGGNPVAGQMYAVCGVSRSATSHTLYVDGEQIAFTSQASTPDALDRTSIGAVRDSSPSFGDGRTSVAMYFDRALTVEEVRSLSANPYQVFRPVSKAYITYESITPPEGGYSPIIDLYYKKLLGGG